MREQWYCQKSATRAAWKLLVIPKSLDGCLGLAEASGLAALPKQAISAFFSEDVQKPQSLILPLLPVPPPPTRSPSVIFQIPKPHLQKYDGQEKSPRLNFLPLVGNQIWNNKYILYPPGKTLLATNAYRLIVLIQCDQGEMVGYLALFWSLAYETPSLCLKEKSLHNRNRSDKKRTKLSRNILSSAQMLPMNFDMIK